MRAESSVESDKIEDVGGAPDQAPMRDRAARHRHDFARDTLPDTEVWISVHGGGTYGGHFQCCAPEQGVEVALRRIPTRPAALAGFVAKDGTIWEIVDVKR